MARFLCGGALQTQHLDFGGHDLRRPERVRKAYCHRHFLRTFRDISDDTPADRATELLAPKLLPGGDIKDIEVL
jgi:hypothetical protein